MRNIQERGLVIAMVCLLGGAAQAQDGGGFGLAPVKKKPVEHVYSSEAQIGVGYVSGDSMRFGRYTGENEQGLLGIGSFRILRRPKYDSDDIQYFTARGTNLGLDSRELHLQYGKQGAYSIRLDYDEIPDYRFGDGRTPYLGVGGSTLQLPATWVGANTTGGMTQLDNTAHPLEISDKRKRLAFGISVHPKRRWKFNVSVRHKERTGTRVTSGIFGTNGGNPASMLLPEPIDYETNDVQAKLEYADRRTQLQVSYLGSFFRDRNSALVWNDAFSDEPAGSSSEWPPSGTSPYAGYPTGRGRLGLPPDNEAHYFNIAAGYDWSQRTRITGRLRYGILLQNDRFLPYTINPNLAVPTGLPRNSLDARIDQVLADLAVMTRVSERLRLRATLRYNDDANKTPRNVYLYVPNDTADQGTIDSALARLNLPYSTRHTQARLKATYRLHESTSLSGGYRYDQRNRTYSEVETTRDQTVNVRLTGSPTAGSQGWIDYAHSRRTGSAYVGNAPFLYSHTPAYLATLPVDQRFQNHPALRKPYLADRNRDRVKGVINFSPRPRLSVNVTGSYSRDRYTASELGLQDASTAQISLQPNYRISKRINTYAYYTFERREHNQIGHSFQPFPPALNSLTDPAQRWSADTTDRIDTIGLGMSWKRVLANTDLSAEYSYSNAVTATDIAAGSDLQPVAPLPDVKSRLHHVSLSLDYHYKDSTTWRLRYIYENYHSSDYAVDNIGPATVPDVLAFGQDSPDYSIHVIGVSVVYRF